jgi:nitrous oxidase accessory protein NosD
VKVVALVATLIATLLFAAPAASAASARTFQVPGDYPTVQAAVNAAPAGSTVNVGSGTFTEELVINKDLNLVGVGAGRAVIKAPASLHAFGLHHPDNRAVTAVVRIGNGAHVRMSGFTVTGPIPCGLEVTGVQVLQGATVNLSDSRVTAIHANPSTCAADNAAGRAIVYGLPTHIDAFGKAGSPAYGRITNVRVDDYQHAGISITGPAGGPLSQVAATNNVIHGGWTLPSFQFGIHVADGAGARLDSNTVTDVVCGGAFCGPDPINNAQGAGIMIQEVAAPVEVTNNTLARNDVGVYQVVSPLCCRIANNDIRRSNFIGIVIQDGDGATRNNQISGGQIGIAVVADFVDTTATLRGDQISGTSVGPIRELECCGFHATAA